MRIAVLGMITRDTFWYPGKPMTESLGGLLYNITALASLSDDTVIPVTNVGADVFDKVTSALSQYPNVVLDGIKKVKSNNIHCFIFFVSEYGTQYDEGREVPITFKQVEPFLDSSLILVSFTTGFDLSLRTLKLISERATCPILLDYHILAFARDSMGNRFLRRRRNWLDWVCTADIVQFNRFEAQLVGRREIDSKEDALRFCKPILDCGVRIVIITLGDRGSMAIYRDKHSTKYQYIKAEPVADVVDPGGCGGVYSAAFIVHYLRYGNVVDGCEYASLVASKKCAVSGYAHLGSIFSEVVGSDEFKQN
jgi:sugar/nucleoside kinase (ribokinase family)